MIIRDCKIGQKVVGNEGSERYSYTCKSLNFVGEIVGIDLDDRRIRVKTLESDRASQLGRTHWVSADCFDLKEDVKEGEVKGMSGMKIVKGSTVINFENIKYGDVVEMADGKTFLIIPDTDGHDFRGLDLETLIFTGYSSSVENLVEDRFGRQEIIKHTPAEKVTLSLGI